MKNKYKYFLVGLCDENFKELSLDSYTRTEVPYTDVIVEKELLGARRIYLSPTFSFKKNVTIGSYCLFTNNGELFSKRFDRFQAVRSWDTVTVNLNILFHDKESIKEYLFE